jgi:molecular chaperone GrpE
MKKPKISAEPGNAKDETGGGKNGVAEKNERSADAKPEIMAEDLTAASAEMDAVEAEIEVVREFEKQLVEKEGELVSLREDVLRVRAEMENFRKRLTKEKNDFAQFANERLLREVIEVYANLDRALNAPNVTVENLKAGVDMIFKQFTSMLDKENVKPIPSLGEKFNPARHDAISQLESDQHEEGVVVQEYSRGYYLNERVLIPSKVVIAKKPVASEEKPASTSEESA